MISDEFAPSCREGIRFRPRVPALHPVNDILSDPPRLYRRRQGNQRGQAGGEELSAGVDEVDRECLQVGRGLRFHVLGPVGGCCEQLERAWGQVTRRAGHSQLRNLGLLVEGTPDQARGAGFNRLVKDYPKVENDEEADARAQRHFAKPVLQPAGLSGHAFGGEMRDQQPRPQARQIAKQAVEVDLVALVVVFDRGHSSRSPREANGIFDKRLQHAAAGARWRACGSARTNSVAAASAFWRGGFTIVSPR